MFGTLHASPEKRTPKAEKWESSAAPGCAIARGISTAASEKADSGTLDNWPWGATSSSWPSVTLIASGFHPQTSLPSASRLRLELRGPARFPPGERLEPEERTSQRSAVLNRAGEPLARAELQGEPTGLAAFPARFGRRLGIPDNT